MDSSSDFSLNLSIDFSLNLSDGSVYTSWEEGELSPIHAEMSWDSFLSEMDTMENIIS